MLNSQGIAGKSTAKKIRKIVCCAGLAWVMLGTLMFPAGAASPQFPVNPLKLIVSQSAACLLFPDGGAMLIDIGKGVSPALIHSMKKQMLMGDGIYGFFNAVGWRPRIDWLVVAPRENAWDTKLVDVLDTFDVDRIYIPFDLHEKSTARISDAGITAVLLQISLASCPVIDLRKHATIDLAQSISKVRCFQLLPAPSGARAREDGSFCFLIVYNTVRILIAGELTEEQQEYLMASQTGALKADIFFHPPNVKPELTALVGASHMLSYPLEGKRYLFSIDGNRISVEENTNDRKEL